MNEKDLERLLKSMDTEMAPPKGLKEDIYARVCTQEDCYKTLNISRFERLIFEKPLLASGVLAMALSAVFWAAAGSGYTDILYNIIGIR